MRSLPDLQAQFQAAQDFAAEVLHLEPLSHRYTAGQAATLAWLVGAAGHPLPTDHGAVPLVQGREAGRLVPSRASAGAVRHLERRARAIVDRAGTGSAVVTEGYAGDPVSHPFAIGIVQVCAWALKRTDSPPFRAADGGAGAGIRKHRRTQTA